MDAPAMVRPKAFDVDAALEAAILVFWDKGYEAASIPDLLEAMGIGRQSMYDTFGDKQTLYAKALAAYAERAGTYLHRSLGPHLEPMAGIRGLLLEVGERDAKSCRRGCLLINAAVDASRDPGIARLVQEGRGAMERALHAAVVRAQAAGDIDPKRDAQALTRFLQVTHQGLVTAARSGFDAASLRDAATIALAALKP
jgi:AcrR family transcriptional regulator